MRLEQELRLAAPADEVWAYLMDVPRMAQCIPGVSRIVVVDDTTYTATVGARIGPIAANFDCTIAMLQLDEVARSGTIEVSGQDRKIGGGVKSRMTMTLQGNGGQTVVRIVSDVDVLGKIGHYGHGIFEKRANAMLTEFAACARSVLEAGGEGR